MKKRKKKSSPKELTVFGIGWYKENQWNLLLKHAVDRDDLEPTYADWYSGITEGINNLKSGGVRVEIIPVDVDEMIKWCKKNARQFDGESRSIYISLKTKEKFG